MGFGGAINRSNFVVGTEADLLSMDWWNKSLFFLILKTFPIEDRVNIYRIISNDLNRLVKSRTLHLRSDHYILDIKWTNLLI